MAELVNPLASASQAYNLLEGWAQDRAQRQAGQAFASGDYGKARNVLGSRGMLEAAAGVTEYEQKQQDRTRATEDDARKRSMGFMLDSAQALRRIPADQRQAEYERSIRPILQQFAPPEALQQVDTGDKSDQALDAIIASLGGQAKLSPIRVAGEDGAEDTILIDDRGEERKRFKGYADPLARDYRRAQIDALQGKTDAAQGKLDDKAAKLQAASEARQFKAQAIIGAVDDVLGKIGQGPGGFSGEAGFVGAQMSQVPGTKAYDVRESLETLKANLGFEELAAMRAASPTGGALGAIAVQELKALQSTVGNLDIGQSHDQLVRELNKIKGHYARWLEAVQQSEAEAAPAQSGGFSREDLLAEARRRGLPL